MVANNSQLPYNFQWIWWGCRVKKLCPAIQHFLLEERILWRAPLEGKLTLSLKWMNFVWKNHYSIYYKDKYYFHVQYCFLYCQTIAGFLTGNGDTTFLQLSLFVFNVGWKGKETWKSFFLLKQITLLPSSLNSLAACKLDASCAGHVHPSSKKTKNVMIRHTTSKWCGEFDTHDLME